MFDGMDAEALQQAVAEAFATTGATTPSWPDPHPRGQQPLDEEYSRCLDPARYRIVRARAEAWVQSLTGYGLAVVADAGRSVEVWRDGPGRDLGSGMWVRPVRADAVPLLVGSRPMDGVTDAVVVVGAGEPAVPVAWLPCCGCDACDDGSDALLEELDEYVLAVVNGTFVHVGAGEHVAVSTGSGWSASGRFTDVDVEALLMEARAGHSQHPVVHGGPWW